jgi:hypothetical protein
MTFKEKSDTSRGDVPTNNSKSLMQDVGKVLSVAINKCIAMLTELQVFGSFVYALTAHIFVYTVSLFHTVRTSDVINNSILFEHISRHVQICSGADSYPMGTRGTFPGNKAART